jgi:hypothetical protein
MEKEYFECSCRSPEHTLSFVLDDDEEFPAIYGYVFLGEKTLGRRIADAVRHVLGYKCRYGHFDEFILDPKDCDRMIGLLKKLKTATRKTRTKRK